MQNKKTIFGSLECNSSIRVALFGVFAVVIMGVLGFGESAGAVTYYVDYETGNDNNSGTIQSSSWQHSPGMEGATGLVASTNLQPGDTIYFKKGVLWPASALPLTIKWSGSEGNPITFSSTDSFGSGERPIFDAETLVNRCFVIDPYDGGQEYYIVIDNLEFRNPSADGSYYWAARIAGGGHNTVRNCKVFGGGILSASSGYSIG